MHIVNVEGQAHYGEYADVGVFVGVLRKGLGEEREGRKGDKRGEEIEKVKTTEELTVGDTL